MSAQVPRPDCGRSWARQRLVGASCPRVVSRRSARCSQRTYQPRSQPRLQHESAERGCVNGLSTLRTDLLAHARTHTHTHIHTCKRRVCESERDQTHAHTSTHRPTQAGRQATCSTRVQPQTGVNARTLECTHMHAHGQVHNTWCTRVRDPVSDSERARELRKEDERRR